MNRTIIRELQHALADLNHEAFPEYAAAWQDDIECAAKHIERAQQAMSAWLATMANPGKGANLVGLAPAMTDSLYDHFAVGQVAGYLCRRARTTH